MREFFKGWRRKVGCVALVVAWSLMAMWVRSFVVRDAISSMSRKHFLTAFKSDQGVWGFEWSSGRRNSFIPEHSIQWVSGKSESDASFSYIEKLPSDATVWRRDIAGLHFGEISKGDRSSDFHYAVIPYWSVTIAPALLSAYLILWKPRTRIAVEAERPR